MAAWNSTIGTIHEQGEIEVYISFHAYAQKLLSSWAVDFSIIPDEPPTLAELQAAGAAATQDRIGIRLLLCEADRRWTTNIYKYVTFDENYSILLRQNVPK